MSTEQISSAPTVGVARQVSIHPLSPLTSSEITASAAFIKGLYPHKTQLQFKAITLQEPPKSQLAPYLDAEHLGRSTGKIDRRVFINYYISNTVSRYIFARNYSRSLTHRQPLLRRLVGQVP